VTALLLDTHALLWFLVDDRRLSEPARAAIAAERNVPLVSAASVWEIAIKAAKGRLTVPSELPRLLRELGFGALEVTHEHAWAAGSLPDTGHQDPFDRVIAAQALAERLPVVSHDRAFDAYGVERCW